MDEKTRILLPSSFQSPGPGAYLGEKETRNPRDKKTSGEGQRVFDGWMDEMKPGPRKHPDGMCFFFLVFFSFLLLLLFPPETGDDKLLKCGPMP